MTTYTIEDFYRTVAGDKTCAGRLIFADWLEERGDRRAEVIRSVEKIEAFNPYSSWTYRGLKAETIFGAMLLKLPLRINFAVDLVETLCPIFHALQGEAATEDVWEWLQYLRGISDGPAHRPVYPAHAMFSPLAAETLHNVSNLTFYVAHRDDFNGVICMRTLISNVVTLHWNSANILVLPAGSMAWMFWRFPVCRLLEYMYFDAKHIWTDKIAIKNLPQFLSFQVPSS